MGVSIIQFVDLLSLFSGLISLCLSDAQVEVMVIVRSAWAGSQAGLLQAHPSVFAHRAISAIDSGHPTRHYAQQTIIC